MLEIVPVNACQYTFHNGSGRFFGGTDLFFPFPDAGDIVVFTCFYLQVGHIDQRFDHLCLLAFFFGQGIDFFHLCQG